MAQWRKVVVSGSTAEFNHVSASGNLVPVTTDLSSLGTSTLNFSDLFLDSGAVVNFNSGDMTLTHASNEVQVDGGDLVVEGTNKIGFGGAPSTDYIQKSTDVKIVAAADVEINAGGGNVKPSANDGSALGVAGTGWSDLFLAEGAVINWDSGDFTATQTNNLLALSGGNTRVDRLEVDSASDYIDVDTDLKIVANADISLEPGGSDVLIGANRLSGSSASTGSFGYLNVYGDGVFGGNLTFGDAATDSVSFSADIDSNLIPNVDDTYDIGSAGQAWQDLFLEGDITLTDAGSVKATAGNLTVDSEAGSLVLDGHTGVDIDASNSGKVAIDGAGGIDIGVAADVAIDVDSSTFDLDASGALTMTSTTMAFDPSSTFDLDAAGAITIDGASITLGGDSDTAFDIDTSTLDIDASGAVTIDTSAGGVSIDAAAASNFSTAAGALLLHGAGGINIGTTADVAIDVDAAAFDLDASGALTLDSATSIAIGANADKPIDIDSTTLDIDASGAITIDSTSTILISGDGGATFSDDTEALIYDGSGNVDFDAVALDIDASAAITIDGTSSISIDVDAASNFNTSAGDITIDSEAGSVNIDGGESAANAIKIVASHGAGGIDIDAGSAGINVDSTGGITVGGSNATGVTLGKSDTTVTVAGSLDVNGTVTTIDSANTYIADKFMIIASGSATDTDGGVLIQNSAGAGYALGYDSGIDRWVFDADLAHNATDIGPDAYVGVIETGTGHGDSQAVPIYGGTTNGVGTIYIDTDAGDQGIWIYS